MTAEVSERWQRYTLKINGEQHTQDVSAVVSVMLGGMVDVLYELYLESNDDSRAERVKYLHDDPDSLIITGVTGCFDWDNEGDTITWTLTRQLYEEPIMLDVEVDYNYGEKLFKYRIPYFDMCYAVAKAATSALSKVGILKYHFMSERDKIDIHHLLYIKHLGIFQKPYPYPCIEQDQSDNRILTLPDELELLRFEL